MKKEENKKNKKDQHFDKFILVNKINLHESLATFRELLKNEKTEYVFFHLEFSDFKSMKLKFTEENERNILPNYLQKLNDYWINKNNQIMFTEFLICKKSKKFKPFKFYTFLIPSLKFHKYLNESLIELSPKCMEYFYHNCKNYKFSDSFGINSLSYMSLSQIPTIRKNFHKTMQEGKTPKNENKKSYYYFPKQIVEPKNEVKEIIAKNIQNIYEILKELKVSTPNLLPSTNFEIINDFFIIEKLFQFEWKNLIQPYTNNLVRLCLLRLEISRNDKIINSQINYFIHFISELLGCMEKLLKSSVLHFAHVIKTTGLDYEVLSKWKNFLCLFFDNKINISIKGINQQEGIYLSINIYRNIFPIHINSNSEKVTFLINFLINLYDSLKNESFIFTIEQFFQIMNFHKFNFSEIFPKFSLEFFDFKYTLKYELDQSSLSEVTFEKEMKNKFNYDYLFRNVNNEQEILFPYILETEIFSFIKSLSNEIDAQLNEQPVFNRITISNFHFYFDFSLLIEQQESKLEEIFGGYITSLKTNNENRNVKFIFKQNKDGFLEFIKNFKPSEREYRYKLLELFLEFKKELVVCEEFGITCFWEHIFECKEINKDIIFCSPNLFHKFYHIFRELYSAEKVDSNQFSQYLQNFTFLDIHLGLKESNLNLFQEINKLRFNPNFGNMLTTKYYFNILNSKLDKGFIEKNKNCLFLSEITEKESLKIKILQNNAFECIKINENFNKIKIKKMNSFERGQMLNLLKKYFNFTIIEENEQYIFIFLIDIRNQTENAVKVLEELSQNGFNFDLVN
jgi:hypothetical protein